MSDSGKIALVHNGIIENEAKLRQWLMEKGIHFHSETDTEVVSNLVGYYYDKYGDLVLSVRKGTSHFMAYFSICCRE